MTENYYEDRWDNNEGFLGILGSDMIAALGGKIMYDGLATGGGGAHEQINYYGHHADFDCMLAEVSNRHPEIGLFKKNETWHRALENQPTTLAKCYMDDRRLYLKE